MSNVPFGLKHYTDGKVVGNHAPSQNSLGKPPEKASTGKKQNNAPIGNDIPSEDSGAEANYSSSSQPTFPTYEQTKTTFKQKLLEFKRSAKIKLKYVWNDSYGRIKNGIRSFKRYHASEIQAVRDAIKKAGVSELKSLAKKGLRFVVKGGGIAFVAVDLVNDVLDEHSRRNLLHARKSDPGAQLVESNGTPTIYAYHMASQGKTVFKKPDGRWYSLNNPDDVPKGATTELLRPRKTARGWEPIPEKGNGKPDTRPANQTELVLATVAAKYFGDRIKSIVEKLVPGGVRWCRFRGQVCRIP